MSRFLAVYKQRAGSQSILPLHSQLCLLHCSTSLTTFHPACLRFGPTSPNAPLGAPGTTLRPASRNRSSIHYPHLSYHSVDTYPIIPFYSFGLVPVGKPICLANSNSLLPLLCLWMRCRSGIGSIIEQRVRLFLF